MSPIRILIVDDHSVVRQGIKSLLSNYPEFQVIGEAENGTAALTKLRLLHPDVTLLDIRMPGMSGLETLEKIRAARPEAKVLMLTSFDDDEYIKVALKTGARGYVLKSVSDESLVSAIQSVYKGERVLSPKITEQVVQWVIEEEKAPARPAAFGYEQEELTILKMLVAGANNGEIADTLYMSQTSVKRKLRKIFAKLGVQTRAQAAAEAVRRQII